MSGLSEIIREQIDRTKEQTQAISKNTEETIKLSIELKTRNELDKEERARNERREIRNARMMWGLLLLNGLLCGVNVTKMLHWW